MRSFDDEDNSLRLNNFATALRELGRVWLEEQAPKERIRACHWFRHDPNLRDADGVTRAQRVKYAVQQELHDNFVLGRLHIDVNGTIKQYTSLIEELNKYTHISEDTFDLPAEQAELLAIRALEVFLQVAELIEDRRTSLQSSATEAAGDALIGELIHEVKQELDCLATHYSVEGVQLENLAIVSLDLNRIVYHGRGNVRVRLQYGSNSDVARDDGLVTYDSYPLNCQFEADTSKPLAVILVSLTVDTSSFYE